ncbi:MAG TPA: hypothetical protein VGP94_08450 [Tepidisphaeraceae bacterium]|nr:hypothetical protein [Tepidisphaeraceae bacterium]
MRMLTRFGIVVALAAAVSASDDKLDRATLRGIKAVCTIVEVTGPTQAGVPVSKERLQAELDGRVAATGLAIDRNATTCLFLDVRPLPAMGRGKAIGRNDKPVGLHALDVTLQFLQTVTLARDPSIKAYAPTWSASNLATVPSDEVAATARQITVDLADRFVKAYQSVNQK